jgi:hypothetical protein
MVRTFDASRKEHFGILRKGSSDDKNLALAHLRGLKAREDIIKDCDYISTANSVIFSEIHNQINGKFRGVDIKITFKLKDEGLSK